MKKASSALTDGVKEPGTGEKSVNERDSHGRFAKGNKSKGGRKPEPKEFKLACAEKTLDALNVIVSIMEDVTQPAASRLKAAQLIIERAYGTPIQTVETSVEMPDCGVVLMPAIKSE